MNSIREETHRSFKGVGQCVLKWISLFVISALNPQYVILCIWVFKLKMYGRITTADIYSAFLCASHFADVLIERMNSVLLFLFIYFTFRSVYLKQNRTYFV